MHNQTKVLSVFKVILFGVLLFAATRSGQTASAASRESFRTPPPSARPWVYWFWLNGNISSNGITADLEAMQRAGIGGVLIMEVDQGAPVGPVDFMSARWRELFKHVVHEAGRLGLEVNMNDDAGWNGSGGPWIKPEQSMQKVVWTDAAVEGGRRFEGILPQPQTVAGFYRDIAVLAFPTPGPFRIENIKTKACYEAAYIGEFAQLKIPQGSAVDQQQIMDLTSKMDPTTGRLAWDAPPGPWTVLRLGHTCTGAENAPAPASGRGLECDKLSSAGIQASFDGMMGKLISDVGPQAGHALAATHIDSWENGAQNWTALMRDEFKQRRGYDPIPFLPVVTGRVVGSLEISERFLWDWRKTISELVVEKYAGGLAKLAHAHGMRLSIEAYGGPCEDLPYAGQADEPMCEFWMGGSAFNTVKGMASAAHTYSKRILGAEAFTAADQEKWLEFPGSIKTLGDRAFCDGVNRFVFHRYAMQPWTEVRRPGMTMGPWGLHYERTQTWWEWSRPWHDYLARCQWMLRQGLFVADVCYLQPEAAPQDFHEHNRAGFDYDECSAEAVLTRMRVENGRITLPDGMSYQLLALPDVRALTPQLLRRIQSLVEAGATVLGPRPTRAPGLTDYPQCDQVVHELATQLWGPDDQTKVSEHRLGRGRIISGVTVEQFLAREGVSPDFMSQPRLRYIHRRDGDREIYFVANPKLNEVEASCTFRVQRKNPELWRPETGDVELAVTWQQSNHFITLPLRLGPAESVFVVFQPGSKSTDQGLTLTLNGKALLPPAQGAAVPAQIVIQKASYGVLDDPKRTRDVRAKLQRLIDRGESTFQVARMAEGDDPAYLVVKTLQVEYTFNGTAGTLQGTDPDTLTIEAPASACPPSVARIIQLAGEKPRLEACQPGRYEISNPAGRKKIIELSDWNKEMPLAGPWLVHFAPGWGAPEKLTFDSLSDWSKNSDAGVRYFSGVATYHKTLAIPPELRGSGKRLYLDLGKVAVMAQVSLNGRELGTLWKAPYRVDITSAVRAGSNDLDVRVANLWVNRLIGDEQLPEDSVRNPDGTLKRWPDWLSAGKPSPTGRLTFTSWRLWKKDSPLQPSGLLGPVTIQCTRTAEIK